MGPGHSPYHDCMRGGGQPATVMEDRTRVAVCGWSSATPQPTGRQMLRLARAKAGGQAELAARDGAILQACVQGETSSDQLLTAAGYARRTGDFRKRLARLLHEELLEMTVPDRPRSPLQKYRLTDKGRAAVATLSDPKSGRMNTDNNTSTDIRAGIVPRRGLRRPGTSSSRQQRELALVDRGCGKRERLAHILYLKIRILIHDLTLAHPLCDKPDDRGHRNTQPPNTGHATHLRRIYADSLEAHPGTPRIAGRGHGTNRCPVASLIAVAALSTRGRGTPSGKNCRTRSSVVASGIVAPSKPYTAPKFVKPGFKASRRSSD